MERMDGIRGRGGKVVKEIDEQLRGSRVGAGAQRSTSSFDVISSFTSFTAQRSATRSIAIVRITGLGFGSGSGYDGPASQSGLRSGGLQ